MVDHDVVLESPVNDGAFLSLQQIFDKALTGVRRQGGPSTVPGTAGCYYRSRNGTRACGVGQLIPHNAYDPFFDTEAEGKSTSVTSLLVNRDGFRNALLAGGVNVDDLEVMVLLMDLQMAHDSAVGAFSAPYDGAKFLERFETEMRRVAERVGLQYAQE